MKFLTWVFSEPNCRPPSDIAIAVVALLICPWFQLRNNLTPLFFLHLVSNTGRMITSQLFQHLV